MHKMPLRPSAIVLSGLQAGINHLLALDTDALAALAQLNGKVIAVEVTRPPYRVFLRPGRGGLHLVAEPPPHIDVSISGSPAALLEMVMATNDSGGRRHVEIRGDIHLAQRLQEIMKSLDVDWEEFISRYAGDMTAHHIARISRDLRHYIGRAGRGLFTQFTEYLHYEQDMLPLRPEIERFNEEVDSLRDDVERMQHRLRRLEQQRGSQS